jgi:phosphohistidine swiveling domain-containing protein
MTVDSRAMPVAWLGEPESLDATSVGGKTANLGRLAASFRIPPGFCLDASTYDELREAVAGDDHARRRLREIIAASYADLARRVGRPEPRVAVRSSAIGEDGGQDSFAGQHETVLNVAGMDAVVEGVLECWRSVSSERAAAYRRERGIPGMPRIAVLVQLMVDADASAIAFSADPVTGARDVVVVNAARGLGDAIASGAVTPDSYTVRKKDLAITARSANGTALSEGDVAAIARLTVQLEQVMDGPVDVECALRQGELHLLQCRPITTLGDEFVVEWADPEDAKLTWRRDDAHHTGVLTPLSIEYTRNGAGYGVAKRDETLGPPVRMRFEAFNGRMYTSTKPLRAPDEMARYQKEAVARRRRLARHIRRDWDERYRPELDEHYAWMAALEIQSLSRDEAAAAWDELWRRHRRAWVIHMLVTAGSYTVMDELSQTFQELVGGPAADAFAITQGLAPTLQGLERDLADLASAAARSPAASEAIARRAPMAELRTADPRFARELDAFLDVHGDAGASAEGLGTASWRDDPALLVATIAQRIAQTGEDPDARLLRIRAHADAIVRRAREALADRPADRERFEEVLAAAVSAGPLTEEHNYWLDRRNQANVGRSARRFGERLVREGALDDQESIFLLYVPEVREALREPHDLSELIARRSLQQRSWKRMRSPETIGAPPPSAGLGSGTTMVALGHLLYKVEQDDPARTLRGVGASAGIARGQARLVRDLAEFPRFRRGDVLVCQSSNVSWIPLFTIAGAVITEVGGALSHAAVVAREFGVPAVVGTGVAVSTLVDGEMVEVDGSAGVVRRLSA